MRYAVLGAGRQGLAIAHDLAVHGEATGLTLVDSDPDALDRAKRRLRRFAGRVKVELVRRDARGRGFATLLRGHCVAISAMPYRFNPSLAKAAVSARASFCDLGGNTDLVREALELDARAKEAGVTIVPDCGLAPGLGNVLASIAMGEVENARHVTIRCGGLPVEPKGALGYSLLFSVEGLTNEYTGQAVLLRDGRLRRIEAFTECEEFAGPRGLGSLECFLTSGGTSTAPWTFRRVLETYDYKTVRYRGHFERMRAMIELGLLELEPVEAGGKRVVPRELFHALARRRLTPHGPVKDLAILRVDCTDAKGSGVRYQMLQYHDEATRFSAMEQTTGYPTAAIAHALARGDLAPGARTPERCGFDARHVRDLRRRGLRIRRTALK